MGWPKDSRGSEWCRDGLTDSRFRPGLASPEPPALTSKPVLLKLTQGAITMQDSWALGWEGWGSGLCDPYSTLGGWDPGFWRLNQPTVPGQESTHSMLGTPTVQNGDLATAGCSQDNSLDRYLVQSTLRAPSLPWEARWTESEVSSVS